METKWQEYNGDRATIVRWTQQLGEPCVRKDADGTTYFVDDEGRQVLWREPVRQATLWPATAEEKHKRLNAAKQNIEASHGDAKLCVYRWLTDHAFQFTYLEVWLFY